MYFGKQGNVGRSRGEQLRIGSAATTAANQENLGYGTAQQSYRNSTVDRYMSALNNLGQYGQFGVNTASQGIDTTLQGTEMAAGITNQANQEVPNFLTGIAGSTYGQALSDADWKKYSKVLNSGGGGVTLPGASVGWGVNPG